MRLRAGWIGAAGRKRAEKTACRRSFPTAHNIPKLSLLASTTLILTELCGVPLIDNRHAKDIFVPARVVSAVPGVAKKRGMQFTYKFRTGLQVGYRA